MDKFKPGRLSPFTRMIEERLLNAEEEELITYDELRKLIGEDCSPGGTQYDKTLSALRRCEKQGANFANVAKHGYVRLPPNDTVADCNHKQHLVRRRIKRIDTKLTCMGEDQVVRLSSIKKREHRTAVIFGRIASRILSQEAKWKMIEAIEQDPQIDYEKITEIYLRKKGLEKDLQEA